jgi:hypothetical protein
MQRVYNVGICPYCKGSFGANVIEKHKNVCKLQNAPIEKLNRGEAKEAGRYNEWLKALEED